MGSRKTHDGADKVYAAAQKWVDRALRSDDSLFTPGKPIWTSQGLGHLRERFLNQPDVGEGSFYDKLRQQLEGSPPEVYQLMGEVLYVHLLILSPDAMKGDTKLDRIQRVLGWSEQQISVPDDKLVAALSSGMVNMGANRAGYLPFYVGYVIEFAEQWKELETSGRQRLLGDSLEFKRFATQVELRGKLFREYGYGHLTQQEALLHLVFPDSFEGIVNVGWKEKIAEAEAFSRFVTEPTHDVDRKIQQIRRGLEADLGRDFDFFDYDVWARWNSSLGPWDEFIRRAKAIFDSAGAMEGEEYKFGIGKRTAEAREAVNAERNNWRELLDRALMPNHPIAWRTLSDFGSWYENRDEALSALQTLWTKDNLPIDERIRAFTSKFSSDATKGAKGSRTTIISALLMGLDVEKYPPFKTRSFNKAYDRTGHDRPERGADEAALYEHALGFLDRLIKEAEERGLSLRHRLDAQSIVWLSHHDEFWNLLDNKESDVPEPQPTPASDLQTLAARLHLSVDFLREIEALLKDKRQVIFQGPPGTGKTYVAQVLAEHFAGSQERVTLVQFHPSYAYEDFVQGYRPTLLENKQPGFKLTDGPLLRAAKQAREESDESHFLIIDEINRGQIAKVFGELYFLLEYRDSEMNLQYSDKLFSLPENLYIVGTMNTADRSIALVDLALRRRFYFVDFHPDDEPIKGVLQRWIEEKAPGMEWVAGVVEQANKLLQEDRDAAIGPSYFMKDGLDDETVERVWKHSVRPYIAELLHGQPDRLDDFDLDRLRRSGSGDGGNSDGQEAVDGEAGDAGE